MVFLFTLGVICNLYLFIFCIANTSDITRAPQLFRFICTCRPINKAANKNLIIKLQTGYGPWTLF